MKNLTTVIAGMSGQKKAPILKMQISKMKHLCMPDIVTADYVSTRLHYPTTYFCEIPHLTSVNEIDQDEYGRPPVMWYNLGWF